MMLSKVRALLPNRPLPLPILGAPFRGATIQLNPRCSMRNMFGLYEHELNPWLENVLPQVSLVLDVGANDGYFTFGCAAAFRRLNKSAQIIGFEPIDGHFIDLQATLDSLDKGNIDFHLYHTTVGAAAATNMMSLDDVFFKHEFQKLDYRALIKIDVEGAEIDVIAGASKWINPKNFFLIEVHDAAFLPQLQQQFSENGIVLQQVNQQPLPFLGRETRSSLNWWLVSDLHSANQS